MVLGMVSPWSMVLLITGFFAVIFVLRRRMTMALVIFASVPMIQFFSPTNLKIDRFFPFVMTLLVLTMPAMFSFVGLSRLNRVRAGVAVVLLSPAPFVVLPKLVAYFAGNYTGQKLEHVLFAFPILHGGMAVSGTSGLLLAPVLLMATCGLLVADLITWKRTHWLAYALPLALAAGWVEGTNRLAPPLKTTPLEIGFFTPAANPTKWKDKAPPLLIAPYFRGDRNAYYPSLLLTGEERPGVIRIPGTSFRVAVVSLEDLTRPAPQLAELCAGADLLFTAQLFSSSEASEVAKRLDLSAAELRIPVILASGPSLYVIDPDGKDSSPVSTRFEAESTGLSASVWLPTQRDTPYLRYGDWLVWLYFPFLVLLTVLGMTGNRKSAAQLEEARA